MDSELVRSLCSITGVDDPALVAEVRDEAAQLLRGAESVTRRLMDGWVTVGQAWPCWVRPGEDPSLVGIVLDADELAWMVYVALGRSRG